MSASSPSSPAAHRLPSSAAAGRASSRGPSTITSSCPAAATVPPPNAAGGSWSLGFSPVVMPLGATGAPTPPDGSGAGVPPLGRVGGGGGGGGGGVEEDRRGNAGAPSEGCVLTTPQPLLVPPTRAEGRWDPPRWTPYEKSIQTLQISTSEKKATGLTCWTSSRA